MHAIYWWRRCMWHHSLVSFCFVQIGPDDQEFSQQFNTVTGSSFMIRVHGADVTADVTVQELKILYHKNLEECKK